MNKYSSATQSPFFNGARELARYIGCDAVTIRRLLRRKAIPFIRFGGRYLFRRSEIEDFLARHSVPALGMGRTHKATSSACGGGTKSRPGAATPLDDGETGDKASSTGNGGVA